MILKRFYEDRIAQASYLVGCAECGEAIVIDPNRNTAQYLEAARAERVRIVGVTETHIHADFVSGARQLATAARAKLHLSDEGGPDWRYKYREDEGVESLRDGTTLRVGQVQLQVRHTPGHTPEHISFIVIDDAASERPMAVLTGDFVFVGDVGRPDLLERAANQRGSLEQSAKELFRSLQKLQTLPDGTLIWPGHGAGSACGKSLGAVPATSVGYERAANWALRTKSEAAFLTQVAQGQPDPPKYFGRMKQINRDGPPPVDFSRRCDPLSAAILPKIAREGELIIDLRDGREVAAGYVAGSIAIPESSLVTWAGWLVKWDQPIYLIAESQAQATRAQQGLALIGMDNVVGWCDAEAVATYGRDNELASVQSLDAGSADAFIQANDLGVLDVRWPGEFLEGRIPGAVNVPLGHLPDRLDEVPPGSGFLVNCQSGVRSLIAVTLLRRLGRRGAVNLRGGFGAYEQTGQPVDTGPSERAVTV